MQSQIRKDVKRQIKNSVSEKDLVVIDVAYNNEKELFWTKPDKEFRYKGEMYDIVRVEINDYGTQYYCIHDFKESNLFAKLDTFVQKQMSDNPQHRKMAENLVKMSVQNVFFQSLQYCNSYLNEKIIKFYVRKENYCSLILDLPTPPPKIS